MKLQTDLGSLFFVILSTFLGAFGSYFFKVASHRIQIHSLKSAALAAFNPFLLAGFSLFFSSALAYLYALSGSALTVIYPLSSLSYVWTLFIGYWFLGEREIVLLRVVGICFIALGIFLVVTT